MLELIGESTICFFFRKSLTRTVCRDKREAISDGLCRCQSACNRMRLAATLLTKFLTECMRTIHETITDSLFHVSKTIVDPHAHEELYDWKKSSRTLTNFITGMNEWNNCATHSKSISTLNSKFFTLRTSLSSLLSLIPTLSPSVLYSFNQPCRSIRSSPPHSFSLP